MRIEGPEAHHATRVLRLGVGAEVVLFDGLGDEATGRICAVAGGCFDVEIVERRREPIETALRLILACAMPKGNRADWLVEKCAELGTSALWPITTERGEVVPGEGRLDRWRRKTVEAAKQSGSGVVMTIEPVRGIEAAAAAIATAASAGVRGFVGDPSPDAAPWAAVLEEAQRQRQRHHDADVGPDRDHKQQQWRPSHDKQPDRHDDQRQSRSRPQSQEPSSILKPAAIVFIGPEGGFSPAEQALLKNAGCKAVRLAEHVLRVETAAIAAASVWAARTSN